MYFVNTVPHFNAECIQESELNLGAIVRNLSDFAAFFHFPIFVLTLFKLDCLRADLPAVLGQDDLLFGCPSFHLSKGFQGNRGGVKSSVSTDTKVFFYTFTGRDKYRALSKEIDVTSCSKGTLIRLVEREKKWL